MHNWPLTWVGFDIILTIMFAGTAILSLLRRYVVLIAAFTAGVLLLCDAWFDITTATGADLAYSIGFAVLAEMPIAVLLTSYCQDLWMGEFQAASSESELGSGSTSLPFSKVAPSRTSFTRCGALTARHFDWAASINL